MVMGFRPVLMVCWLMNTCQNDAWRPVLSFQPETIHTGMSTPSHWPLYADFAHVIMAKEHDEVDSRRHRYSFFVATQKSPLSAMLLIKNGGNKLWLKWAAHQEHNASQLKGEKV